MLPFLIPAHRVTRRDGSIMSEEGEVTALDDDFVGCAGAELVSRAMVLGS